MTRFPSDPKDLAQVATEVFVATQTATLRVLEAEIYALAHLIPSADPVSADPLPSEDEVEKGFDNMPV